MTLFKGMTQVKAGKICNTELVIQCYGGGTRYHCPTCDVMEFNGLPHAYWTNAHVPTGTKCQKKAKVPYSIWSRK